MYRWPVFVGDRVAIAPHTDLWMRGVRFGHVCDRVLDPETGDILFAVATGSTVVNLHKDDLLGAVRK